MSPGLPDQKSAEVAEQAEESPTGAVPARLLGRAEQPLPCGLGAGLVNLLVGQGFNEVVGVHLSTSV
ncbi:MAG TPA: hypothetical protein VGX75_15080 [bacterium]|nr:hypothetical protein [bacterium]